MATSRSEPIPGKQERSQPAIRVRRAVLGGSATRTEVGRAGSADGRRRGSLRVARYPTPSPSPRPNWAPATRAISRPAESLEIPYILKAVTLPERTPRPRGPGLEVPKEVRPAMITANFVHRTFRIKCDQAIGTAFTVDVDGKQYLLTAKHVVERFGSDKSLQVFGKGKWSTVPAALVGHGDKQNDVSVFAPTTAMSPPNLPVVVSSDGLAYGQDVYFLGFPYGVLSEVIFGEAGHPLPLVKKAILSTFAGNVYLLDGHNNPGFSGGPLIFGRGGSLPSNAAAIVSGYRFDEEAVIDGGRKTRMMVRSNTGIIVAYKIEIALELIRANPIGAVVS
jgi:S1-C subfamily serine protease